MRFALSYTPERLEKVIAELRFPDRFLLGAATAGYQVEGGYNGPGEPRNNWYPAESAGKVPKTGKCARFWDLYDEDFARCEWMGLNAFRLGMDWTRFQPSADPASRPAPPLDENALDAYARILASCLRHGMTPAVTLHHFVNPLWAGRDLWLDRSKVEDLFVPAVRTAVAGVNERLIGVHKTEPIPFFITMNEPMMLASGMYLFKQLQAGPRAWGAKPMRTALENILIAHCLLYRELHKLYREKGWPAPTITYNGWCSSAYAVERLHLDMILARQVGVPRGKLEEHLAEERRVFLDTVARIPRRTEALAAKRGIERLIERGSWRFFGPDKMTGLADVVYATGAGAGAQTGEVLNFAVGFYRNDPFAGSYVDFGFPVLVRPRAKPWEWLSAPYAYGTFLDAYQRSAHGLPILTVENGIGIKGEGRTGSPRPDGADRADALRSHLVEALDALNRGVRLEGYFYWSLVDNYEWGSFKPRFGLFGLDYENGAARLKTDIAGCNAAGAYRAIVRAFRARDKRALLEAFRSKTHEESPV